MSVYEMAKKYYPRLWDNSRLEALVTAGKLAERERDQIVNKNETEVRI